jgi:hypothetical protein
VSDVTAVVLSIGEPYVERALASLRRQTLRAVAIVRIDHVRPFYRAMNEAAAQVGTPFFLQLDADMIANDWCVEELRAAMEDDTGMATGPLWDPLMGVEPGIKLFRTESVRQLRFRDRISPAVDFSERLPGHAWRAAFVLPSRPSGSSATPWPTFGRHEPDYTPAYAYKRAHLLGVRYRRRRDFAGLRWRYERLLKSSHPLALLARIALVAGVFRDGTDASSDTDIVEETMWMHRFVNQPVSDAAEPRQPVAASADSELFASWHDIGVHCRRTMDAPTFRRLLDAADCSQEPTVWYQRLGLCHGVIFGACGTVRVQASFAVLAELVAAPPPS